MARIRILIADDHSLIRRGIRSLLESRRDWEICGEAVNGREAVKHAVKLKPEVVVMDITMPELNGLEATRQIISVSPRTEVLILTMDNSEEVARHVLRAGARGIVLKSDVDSLLISAVDALSHHKPFLTPFVTSFVLDKFVKEGQGDYEPLTPREREIVQLLAEGKSNKSVASTLGISIKTAESHRANIMRKLSLRSVSDLVRYAVRNRIVSA